MPKIHPLRDAGFDVNCLTPLGILKIMTVGLKIFGNAVRNCYILLLKVPKKNVRRLI